MPSILSIALILLDLCVCTTDCTHSRFRINQIRWKNNWNRCNIFVVHVFAPLNAKIVHGMGKTPSSSEPDKLGQRAMVVTCNDGCEDHWSSRAIGTRATRVHRGVLSLQNNGNVAKSRRSQANAFCCEPTSPRVTYFMAPLRAIFLHAKQLLQEPLSAPLQHATP